nr:hypothetical protein [Tanacetum cinerariifolium]
MASITFFVFLTLALSFTTIHARESQFFAKVANNIPQESQPLKTNEKDLKYVPQTRETTQGSGYGLFGHESGQLPPSATTTNNNNENKNNNNNYLPTNLPENYNYVAYTTPIHSSTQDIPNEFRYVPQAHKGDNNNMYNSKNQEEFLQTNDDNLFNSQNQDEFMQTNDANMYNSNKQEMGTNGGNMYNNNYEKQRMSDTRFLNNGKYYAGDNTYNSQKQGFGGARFVETQDSGNNNMFNNQKQGVNGYNKNQEMYNSGNQGMGENKYTTTKNNGNMYNPKRQGMSDTKFLENGEYYYDLNLENQNLNSRGKRNGFETQGYYGNNDNSYDRVIITLLSKVVDLLQFCLFSCFLSQEEPKKIFDALKDPSWVLKNKKDEREIVIRNKARLVAQGYTQEEGIDYEKVFAPVARIETIRLFLAYASLMGFIVYQMDVKSAFLYGTIVEEVYVIQPLGFQDPEFPDRVYKVEKATYGLHQAPRAWYVLQKKDGIFLSQDKYVGDILKKFGYSDVRSANTPMNKENHWGKDGPGKDVELYLYRSMIGSLMYLTASRPDIMFAVCACARHQVTPKECYLHIVKRIFRYLKDSDYGGATQDRKSTTRGCQFLGRRLISCSVDSKSDAGLWSVKVPTHNFISFLTLTTYQIHNDKTCFLRLSQHGRDLGENRAQHRFSSDSGLLEASDIRIETTNLETKILATVDGKPRTISESSLRRHLKLNDEEGINSLLDTELFKNLSLMGYNILPNQIFTFQKGQFSHQWKFLIHTIMQCLSPKITGFNEFSSNIATAVVCLATNRVYNFSKMIFDGMVRNITNKPASFLKDDRQGDAFPTVSSLDAGQDRENINKTSALPHDSSPRVTSLDADEGNQDLKISSLKARVMFLEDKDKGSAVPTQEDAPIKKGIMKLGEEVRAEKSTELGSNDTKEMINVPSSMEAANILTSRVTAVSVSYIAGVSTTGVPTVSRSFPTVSVIFTTASVVSEQLARDSEIARLHAEEELKRMIEGLDWSNEVIAKHLQEYEQAEAKLTVGEKLELINELKQFEDFMPMSSKEEDERVKRKGLKLDQRSAKRMKTFKDVSEEDLKGMMQLVPLEEVYVEALQFDREDLHQLWTLVKETLSIRHAIKDKEKELWVELKRLFKPNFKDQIWTHTQALMHDPLNWKLYDTCSVHHVSTKDQEIFMLVERYYPLRRGLATVMICNKL